MANVTSQMLQQETRAAAQRYGLDPDLFERQMRQESGFAIDVALGTRLSSAGAGGVGQFMPATWAAVVNQHPELAQFGADPSPEGRFNPVANINAAAAHMSDLQRQFGNLRDALIAYNAGPAAVGRQLFDETRSYISNILGQFGGDGVTNETIETPGFGAGFIGEGIQSILDAIGSGRLSGSSAEAVLRANDWVETNVPGVWLDTISGRSVDLNNPLGTDGGTGDIGPIQADLEQQRIDLDARISDMQNRIRDANLERQDAIAAGNLDLAFQTENRIRQFEQQRIELDRQRTLIDFQVQQQQLGLQGRGQDIQQRGQDMSAQLDFLSLQFQDLQSQRQDAIARGDQQLAAQIEQRMRFIAESGNAIAQGSQNVDAASLELQAQIAGNDQQIQMFQAQIDAATQQGNLQLARDIENRQRALMQQNAVLQQNLAEQQSASLGIEAQRGAGNIFTQLANTEQQRLSELQQLAANPRDFAQLQFALGSGQSFIQDLLNGQAPGGQSVFGVGDTPLLGGGFDQLIQQLGQRPAFDAAMGAGQAMQNVPIPDAPSLDLLLQLGMVPPQGQMPQFPNAPNLSPIQMPEIPQIQFPDMPQFQFNQPPPIPSATATSIDPAMAQQVLAQVQAEGGGAAEYLRRIQEMQGNLPGLTFTPPPAVAPAPQLPVPTQLPAVTTGPPLTPASPQPVAQPVAALPPPQPQPVPSLPGATISPTGSPIADQLLIDTATPGGDPNGAIAALLELQRQAGLIP